MTSQELFFAVFGAVLAAILLGASCVWGFAKYARLERDGLQKGEEGRTALIAILMPFGFLILTLFAVLP